MMLVIKIANIKREQARMLYTYQQKKSILKWLKIIEISFCFSQLLKIFKPKIYMGRKPNMDPQKV